MNDTSVQTEVTEHICCIYEYIREYCTLQGYVHMYVEIYGVYSVHTSLYFTVQKITITSANLFRLPLVMYVHIGHVYVEYMYLYE